MPDEKKPSLPGVYDTFDPEKPVVQTFEVRPPTSEEVARANKILDDMKEGKMSYFEVHTHDEEDES